MQRKQARRPDIIKTENTTPSLRPHRRPVPHFFLNAPRIFAFSLSARPLGLFAPAPSVS